MPKLHPEQPPEIVHALRVLVDNVAMDADMPNVAYYGSSVVDAEGKVLETGHFGVFVVVGQERIEQFFGLAERIAHS